MKIGEPLVRTSKPDIDSIILEPREKLTVPFRFGSDWDFIIVGFSLGITSIYGDNDPTSILNIRTSTLTNFKVNGSVMPLETHYIGLTDNYEKFIGKGANFVGMTAASNTNNSEFYHQINNLWAIGDGDNASPASRIEGITSDGNYISGRSGANFRFRGTNTNLLAQPTGPFGLFGMFLIRIFNKGTDQQYFEFKVRGEYDYSINSVEKIREEIQNYDFLMRDNHGVSTVDWPASTKPSLNYFTMYFEPIWFRVKIYNLHIIKIS